MCSRPLLFVAFLGWLLATSATGVAEASVFATISPSADGLTTVINVSWDEPVPSSSTLTINPTNPVNGSAGGAAVILDIFSFNIGSSDVGNFVSEAYNAAYFFHGQEGVASNPPGFGVVIDDDTAGGTRIDDDFAIAVPGGTVLPAAGSFLLTMPAYSAGFGAIFNAGQYSNNNTTVIVQVPEPGTALYSLAGLSLLFRRCRRGPAGK